MPTGSILVADDDAAIRTVLNQALSRAGYEVRSTGNAATLWRWVTQGDGDLIITDVVMPDENAFDLIPRIRKTRPDLPIIVMKKELANIPLFGLMTRRYGVIAVERSAGAKALRSLVQEGQQAIKCGRSVLIYPEGTRVRPGEAPPLKSGFAALYRALGLPVTPVAVDSGRLWGRGLIHRSGMVTFRVGETIPAGLPRQEIEGLVHSAINALELGPQTRS